MTHYRVAKATTLDYGQPIPAYVCSMQMLRFFQYKLIHFFVEIWYAIDILNLQFEVVWPCIYAPFLDKRIS